MTSAKWQAQEAINEGLPPVTNAFYDDPAVRKVYPFADLLREQLKDFVVRPATPSYSDVTLAIQSSLHPPAGINPPKSINTLRDRLNSSPTEACTDGRRRNARRQTAAPPAAHTGLTDRARAERKLAWMLCAPAVSSCCSSRASRSSTRSTSRCAARIRFPNAGEFVGFSNYSAVLQSSTWWTDVGNTLFITVISVRSSSCSAC